MSRRLSRSFKSNYKSMLIGERREKNQEANEKKRVKVIKVNMHDVYLCVRALFTIQFVSFLIQSGRCRIKN